MPLKHYNSQLSLASELEEGKTYYKNLMITYPAMCLPKIEIISITAGVATVKIGKETSSQTITEDQALLYINCQGGYSDTA